MSKRINHSEDEDNDLDISFERLNFGSKQRDSVCLSAAGDVAAAVDIVKSPKTTAGSEDKSSIENRAKNIFQSNSNIDAVRDFKVIQKICKNRKKRKKPKSIIQKAKLILPKELQSTKKDYSSNSNDTSTDTSHCDNKECTCLGVQELTVIPFRQEQYLHQNCRTNNTSFIGQVDSNPDELASYFEQMLYIPKPMSLMAEMMYA